MMSQPPGLSALELMTPASIGIDFNNGDAEQEIEREREEKELQDYLAAELDDLTDDEEDSHESHDLNPAANYSAHEHNQDFTAPESHAVWSPHQPPLTSWPSHFDPTTSTPHSHAPPLPNPVYPNTYQHYPYAGFDYGERGEVEGANEEEFYDPHYNQGHNEQLYPYQDTNIQTYTTDMNYIQDKNIEMPHTVTNAPVHIQSNCDDVGTNADLMQTWPPKGKEIISPRDMDNYRVAYRGDNLQTDPKRGSPRKERDFSERNIQEEFLNQNGNGAEKQHTQLRILYDARGKRIEELSSELDRVREVDQREIRILKHQLTLAEDQANGHQASLEQNQNLLVDAKRRENDLIGKQNALEAQLNSLHAAKEELIKKLQISESTVDSLNKQLMELGSNETFTRTRQQHDAMINSLHQKHEKEIHVLHAKLDALDAQCQSKGDENDKLRRQLAESQKIAEHVRIDRAEVINRLTQSLEQSQRQCQELLDSGASNELSRTKLTLQEAIAAKSITQDMNSALQNEVQDLKEQIHMFETASSFGLLQSTSSLSNDPRRQINMDDSYSQLAIKKNASDRVQSANSTPDSQNELRPNPGEDTKQGLKTELERCLSMYAKKRKLVDKLQLKLSETKSVLEQTELKLIQAEKARDRNSEERNRPDNQVTEAERDSLSQQVKELKKRLVEVSTNEERLTALNAELSSNMAEMVKENDEGKRDALEKCKEVMQQHFDESKQILRNEISNQYQQELEKVVQPLNECIAKLQEELVAAQTDADESKELYVQVCREKDSINMQWNNRFTEEKNKIVIELENRIKEIESLREEKNKIEGRMKKEFELKLSSAIDMKITEEKMKWIKEDAKNQDFQETAYEKLLLEMKEKFEREKEEWIRLQQDNGELGLIEKLKGDLNKAMESKERALVELKTIVAQKEQERRQAVLEVQEQCEVDYKQFIKEHQDTLDKALKSARIQFAQEKSDLEMRHNAELENVRLDKNNPSMSQADEKLWEDKIAKMRESLEEEKLSMVNLHRQNMVKALKELEENWQKKLETALSENGRSAQLQRELEWKKERLKYENAIKEREEVIQNADGHMEEEIQKLHTKITEQCQVQVDEHLHKIEEEYEEKLKGSALQVEELVTQIENLHTDMQKLQSKYSKDMKKMAAKLVRAEDNMKTLDRSCKEKEGLKIMLDKTEKQRQEATNAYQKAEEDHVKIVTGYKDKLQELNERVQKTEKHLREIKSSAKEQMEKITKSLEREHANAIDNLRTRFMEQHDEDLAKREAEREAYERAKDKLEVKLTATKEELHAVKMELKRKEDELRENQRQKTHTPTQTDDLNTSQSVVVSKLREQYMEAVNKIRDDALRHIQESNDKAAMTVREEIAKVRQSTAKRLRKYCMSSLEEVLSREEAGNKAEKLDAMRHHLDHLPDKDDSNGSSNDRSTHSCTPTQENIVTPRSLPLENRRPKNLGLPEESGYDNVTNWISQRTQQSTPKVTRTFTNQYTPPLSESAATQTPTPETPGYAGNDYSTMNTRCFRPYHSPFPSDVASRGTLGYADSTSTPALNISLSGQLSASRNDWQGSTESLSAIDFGSKEIRLKPPSKPPSAAVFSSTYKYTPLRQKYTCDSSMVKSNTFPDAQIPSSVTSSGFRPVLPRQQEEPNLHRPTPLMSRETQAPTPSHFQSQAKEH